MNKPRPTRTPNANQENELNETAPAVAKPETAAPAALAVPEQIHQAVPAGMVLDLERNVTRARRAMMRLPQGDDTEAEVTVATQVKLTAETQAEVLRQAYEWALRADGVEIQAAGWARVPGIEPDATDFRLTLTVTFPDRRTGLTGEETHHDTGR
ncbi:hypothetical protein [Kitasatospora sp. NBC_01302]|uniref:hypothetical protein n=1 Tax=Kitasatospora sp. NBC_01302 TaxID=2903575 RepID=UPI002E153A92|nr:hypothetical protein OG294_40995 [Kitasatospora sp. NBC_01302]